MKLWCCVGGLTLETSAFESLYGGQFTLSTQLIKQNYLLKNDHSSTFADHVKNTGHYIKWEHLDILASGKTDYHCKVKVALNSFQHLYFDGSL